MKYLLNIFLHNISSWYWQISTHKVAKIQLLGTIIHYIKYKRIQGVENEVLARKNGRKSKILWMKYPLNIFLQNMASWYWQIFTHNVAKIRLLGTKIHYTKF